MFKKISLLVFLLLSSSLVAQDVIKTMFYNLLEFPTASPGSRDQILQNLLNEYDPDIFMVCELENEAGADQILNISLNDEGIDYKRVPFVLNTSGDSNLQQLIYYRNGMFEVETTEIIRTDVRDINRYQLRINTTDNDVDPLFVDIYVSHLKSSQGSSNEAKRLEMVTEFTNSLSSLDPNSFVIFAGDLNVYDADEPAYVELLDPSNAITLADPIDRPGDWNNNIAFQDIHTQSTRVSAGPFGAGAGGGLDDRFDFILVSENMMTDPKLRYIPDTYKSFGNNGNCFNMDISDANCTGPFGQQLRNNLFSMSDHLPVVMQLETNKQIILNTAEVATEAYFQLDNTIVSETIRLKMSAQVIEPVSIQIFSVLGQEVMHIPAVDETYTTIDVSALPTGIYYLKTNLPSHKPLKFLKTS